MRLARILSLLLIAHSGAVLPDAAFGRSMPQRARTYRALAKQHGRLVAHHQRLQGRTGDARHGHKAQKSLAIKRIYTRRAEAVEASHRGDKKAAKRLWRDAQALQRQLSHTPAGPAAGSSGGQRGSAHAKMRISTSKRHQLDTSGSTVNRAAGQAVRRGDHQRAADLAATGRILKALARGVAPKLIKLNLRSGGKTRSISPNPQRVHQLLVSNGLSPNAANAVVANAMRRSGRSGRGTSARAGKGSQARRSVGSLRKEVKHWAAIAKRAKSEMRAGQPGARLRMGKAKLKALRLFRQLLKQQINKRRARGRSAKKLERKLATVERAIQDTELDVANAHDANNAPGQAHDNGLPDNANGADPNGTDPNGDKDNGTDPSGTDPNGTDPNGTDPNGTDPNGTEPNGDKDNERWRQLEPSLRQLKRSAKNGTIGSALDMLKAIEHADGGVGRRVRSARRAVRVGAERRAGRGVYNGEAAQAGQSAAALHEMRNSGQLDEASYKQQLEQLKRQDPSGYAQAMRALEHIEKVTPKRGLIRKTLSWAGRNLVKIASLGFRNTRTIAGSKAKIQREMRKHARKLARSGDPDQLMESQLLLSNARHLGHQRGFRYRYSRRVARRNVDKTIKRAVKNGDLSGVETAYQVKEALEMEVKGLDWRLSPRQQRKMERNLREAARLQVKLLSTVAKWVARNPQKAGQLFGTSGKEFVLGMIQRARETIDRDPDVKVSFWTKRRLNRYERMADRNKLPHQDKDGTKMLDGRLVNNVQRMLSMPLTDPTQLQSDNPMMQKPSVATPQGRHLANSN